MLRFRRVEEPSGIIRSGSPQRGFLIHVNVSSFTIPENNFKKKLITQFQDKPIKVATL